MVELRLVGLSQDRRRLILASATGQEFTLAVDDRLRAALRGDRARLGQLEIQMDSALRPRDIQARIRAGQSPEAVAQVAQVPVEKIMGYAVPVLAEREHMAERAQRSAVRRRGVEGASRLLGEAVTERLRSSNVDPESAAWDAWRREDGKWAVTVNHTARGADAAAMFIFDPLGRYAVADDDDARWLLGEQPPPPPVAEEQQDRPVRRLTAVVDAAPRSRETHEALPFEGANDLTAVVDAVRDEDSEDWAERRAVPDVNPDADGSATADEQSPEEAPEEAPKEAPEEPHEDVPRRRGRKGRGRASVPSWDEIMFGRTKE
jgi:Protein of unknown function (DUF3071)